MIDKTRTEITKHAPTFENYFENKVLPYLKENFEAQKLKNYNLKISWTNNNAESLHHILKQAVGWKPQKLPALVEKLHGIVQSQYKEIKRSLIGLGDYVIDDQFKEFTKDSDTWLQYTTDQRNSHFARFQRKIKEINPKVTRTTDGTRTVLTPSHRGKKPGQRKRKISERTNNY